MRRLSKGKAWQKAKKKLIAEYKDKGITYCEACGGNFALSFHHLRRRSKGGGHTFENTVLLCAKCHHKADNAPGHIELNESLKKLR
jgi:5-methylcytosine-specific restriction endonuclease McrA